MLVHDFTYVDRPVEHVAGRLRDDPEGWLTAVAVASRVDEASLCRRVGEAGDVPFLRRTAFVTCGDAAERGDVLLLPIAWMADRLAGTAPILEAEVEVAPLGADRTQVSLSGRYEPPAGDLGHHVDRLVLHRVAQATVRAFLERMRQTLDG
ncbi:MAG TPA: hypothetical protein VFO60_06275 [Candidatus Dormibacteraeota bacterium]|nr:hypothetical protein [Candidatus Dormibacteraeota bacterium]